MDDGTDDVARLTEAAREPFLVRTHGMVDRSPFHSTPGTKEGDVMLTVFLSGRGIYRNRSGRVRVGPGMIGLVPPDDPGVLLADTRDPYTHYYCRFSGEYARAMAQRIISDRGSRFFRSDAADAVVSCIQRMGPSRHGPLSPRFAFREVLLAEALVLLRDMDIEPQNTLTAERLIRTIEEHVSEPTDLSLLAAKVGVSVPTLCRKARMLCGSSVQKLSEHAKLSWAQRLLESTDLPVSEIAFRVGYYDPLYFSRVFKTKCGRSPRGWREHNG